MNWKRGLFRLWVIAAAAWLLAVGVVTGLPHALWVYWDFRDVPAGMAADARADYVEHGPWEKYAPNTEASAPDTPPLPKGVIRAVAVRELGRRLSLADQAVNEFLWAGLAPPLVVLAVGAGLRWALRGFRNA